MVKFVVALLATLALFSSQAFAVDVLQKACSQGGVGGSSVCQDHAAQSGGTNPVNRIVLTATNIVAAMAGVAAIIMIIVSAFKFVTGGADQQAVVAARNTLLWAVVGLAVVGLAWTIITFAVNRLIQN